MNRRKGKRQQVSDSPNDQEKVAFTVRNHSKDNLSSICLFPFLVLPLLHLGILAKFSPVTQLKLGFRETICTRCFSRTAPYTVNSHLKCYSINLNIIQTTEQTQPQHHRKG